MICKNCGKSIPDGSAFCEHCNTNFYEGNETNELLKAVIRGQKENLRMLKSISSSTAILAVFLLIEILLALMIVFNR